MTTETIRAPAVRMLADGVATMSEVAELASTSRQLVRHWAKQAGIDAAAARAEYLQRAWAAANRPILGGVSKASVPKRKRR